MKDTAKTNKQLIEELDGLRREQVIEQALERVRTEVAAMQQSDDLFKVIDVVRETLIGLDVPRQRPPTRSPHVRPLRFYH